VSESVGDAGALHDPPESCTAEAPLF
jgi:hypothetical protein